MEPRMYVIEWDGEHYQTVAPREHSELSQLHTTLDDAFAYLVIENGISIMDVCVMNIKEQDL